MSFGLPIQAAKNTFSPFNSRPAKKTVTTAFSPFNSVPGVFGKGLFAP